jgi:hypothetical protein
VYVGIPQIVRLLIKRGALWQTFEVQRRRDSFETLSDLIWYARHRTGGAECADVLEAYLCAKCEQ